MTDITWTDEELATFDRLTLKMSSQNQMARIEGRIEVREFREIHGESKCDAMFAYLMERDRRGLA